MGILGALACQSEKHEPMLRGRVAAGDRPVVGAMVAAWPETTLAIPYGEARHDGPVLFVHYRWDGLPAGMVGVTDEDGRFSLHPIPGHTCLLVQPLGSRGGPLTHHAVIAARGMTDAGTIQVPEHRGWTTYPTNEENAQAANRHLCPLLL